MGLLKDPTITLYDKNGSRVDLFLDCRIRGELEGKELSNSELLSFIDSLKGIVCLELVKAYEGRNPFLDAYLKLTRL